MSFTTLRGCFLRAARLSASAPVGSIHITFGQTDFIESIYLLMADLNRRGYTVTTLEREGEGLSGRSNVNPQFPTGIGHDVHLADLNEFLTQISPPAKNLPAISLSACVGSLVMLRFIHDYPRIFSQAHLAAPLLGRGEGLGRKLSARFNGKAARSGERYVPGAHDWSWDLVKTEMANPGDTSDLARFQNFQLWQYFHEDLRTGGYTYANLAAVLMSLDIVHTAGFAENITTPIFIHTPTDDRTVSVGAQAALCSRLPRAGQHFYHGAKHVLWDELPVFRMPLFNTIDRRAGISQSVQPNQLHSIR